jgi:hypothetical protein
MNCRPGMTLQLFADCAVVELCGTRGATVAHAGAALSMQVKDFAELSTSVAQLSRRVARIVGAPGALSETERALAAAQVGVGWARQLV